MKSNMDIQVGFITHVFEEATKAFKELAAIYRDLELNKLKKRFKKNRRKMRRTRRIRI